MIYLSVTYKVEDFKKWYRAFSENEPKRMQAGLRVENIFREFENINQIKVLMSVESLVTANEYIELVTTPEYLDKLSIISPVEIKFWDVFY
ncbi:MAG: hypothetical protein ACOCWM_01100 [Cyclobacteriaceae bacterium]